MGGDDILRKRVAAALVDTGLILVLLILIAVLFGNDEASNWSLWAETQGRPRVPILYVVGAITVVATGERRLRLGDLAAGTRVVDIGDRSEPPDQPPPPASDDDVLASV